MVLTVISALVCVLASTAVPASRKQEDVSVQLASEENVALTVRKKQVETNILLFFKC